MEFRKLDSVDELSRVHDLDQKIWGMEPTPIDQTLTAAKNGGLVIGAFLNDQLVGFSYGFPGYRNKEIYLCSHKLAVLPEFRDRNIGYHLKQQQAHMAREIGYERIRWTYDPLEARNAYLNIAKLGAVCSEYIENCYGEMQDKFNANLPSDRFNVDWYLSRRPSVLNSNDEQIIDEPIPSSVLQASLLLNWRLRSTNLPEPVPPRDPEAVMSSMALHSPGVLYIPIPRNFQSMKQTDAVLAKDWRMATRSVFQCAFTAGWAVTGIAPHPSDSVQLYVLSRERI